MNCRRVRHSLLDYVSRERSSDLDTAKIEQHLSKCALCAREMRSLRIAYNAMHADRSVVEPSPNFAPALQRRIKQECLAEKRPPADLPGMLDKWISNLLGMVKYCRIPELAAAVVVMAFFITPNLFPAQQPATHISMEEPRILEIDFPFTSAFVIISEKVSLVVRPAL